LTSNVLAIFMLLGGVFFTIFAVAAWKMGRRAGALLLAVLAGINLAMAIEFLRRFYER
jgi:mannose/fructose-specific phosphotransferase system component IIA